MDAPDAAPAEPARSGPAALIPFAAALASLAYAGALHHGLGPPPALGDAWWHPTGFLREREWVAALGDSIPLGIALLTAPAAAVLVALHARPAPALARALAAVATASAAIFSFYGLLASATGVWKFFQWRGSAVMLASGVLLGCTLAAPDLARALRRLPPGVATVVYAVPFVAASALIRNATGWDPQLAFNISPWPAIPVLALEIGAYTWAGVLLGTAVAAASTAHARTAGRRAAGIAIGVLVPVVWFAARFPHTGGDLLVAGAGLSAGLVAAALLTARRGRGDHAEQAASLVLAATLVALPLFTGRAMADGDFAVSKHVRARVVTDALAAHYEDEGIYPETLDELVELGHLESIPRPRVGSDVWRAAGLTDRPAFDYRNLGSSYVLEFVATEWVMCSYNPPWEDEIEDVAFDDDVDLDAVFADCIEVCHASCDDDERDCDADCGAACEAERSEHEAIAEAQAQDAGGEAWSCPDARPELW